MWLKPSHLWTVDPTCICVDRRQVLNSPQVKLSQKIRTDLLLQILQEVTCLAHSSKSGRPSERSTGGKCSESWGYRQMKGLRPKALCWRHVSWIGHVYPLDLASPKQTRDSYATAPARELSSPWRRTVDRFRDKLKANPKSKPRTKFQS